MDEKIIKRRWLAVMIFFCFLFIQQFDVLIMGSLRLKIVEVFNSATFNSDLVSILLVFTIMISILFWGFGFDRHSRRNLMLLAGTLWLALSWLTSIAPTFETFAISYLGSWVDYGCIIGIYSLVGDYFTPRNRGKIFGLLQAAQPFSTFIVLLRFQDMFSQINWRYYLLVSGALGLTLGLIIFLFIREPKRGLQEPALRGIQISGQYLFDWEIARDALAKPSLIFLCGASLFSSLPWMAMSLWISSILQESQSIIHNDLYLIVFPVIIALILGHALGGFLGDAFLKQRKRGRVTINIITMAIAFMTSISAFMIGDVSHLSFRILVTAAALFFTMGRPNLIAMLYDIALPEIRGTATAIVFIAQIIGLGAGALLVRVMENYYGPGTILFSLTLTAIFANFLLLSGLYIRMPVDIENLRRHMAYRSQLESRLESQKS